MQCNSVPSLSRLCFFSNRLQVCIQRITTTANNDKKFDEWLRWASGLVFPPPNLIFQLVPRIELRRCSTSKKLNGACSSKCPCPGRPLILSRGAFTILMNTKRKGWVTTAQLARFVLTTCRKRVWIRIYI